VFRAVVFGHTVAIKMFNETERKWDDQQIQSEVELLARTRHPHINRLIAISFDGPWRCLVLEYMDGGALEDRLMNTDLPVLQWEDRARILLHIARGLVYMHSLDPPVIHRDVKTANVLLQHGKDGAVVAKVSDFGTARVNKEQQEGLLRTSIKTHASTKQKCGTGPFMPPEYALRGQVSSRTDSFAFGMVSGDHLCVSSNRYSPDPIPLSHIRISIH
jgi:Serine/threonine protein kinase